MTIARTHRALVAAAAALTMAPIALHAQSVPRAIYTDPPHDAKHPARMEVLHIPSGGVKINGVAYVAAGAGLHPTFVLFHGLPGNEKNLDLAQAVRRAGWNAITVNYRGSWGSPGPFSFANVLADVDAVLAFLHDSATIHSLGIDTTRLVIAGHSMGGWTVVHAAAMHPELRGAVLISAADMGRVTRMPRAQLVPFMADNIESLATTPEAMADEMIANGVHWRFSDWAPQLTHVAMLVLTANDGLAPANDTLVAIARAHGNTHITAVHVATDHSWSDRRIELEALVLNWLAARR